MTRREESTTGRRRRVRTGCLTCRKRRRKCPEEKPVCGNCKEKNLQCRYGVQVVFIDADTGERERMPDPPRKKANDGNRTTLPSQQNATTSNRVQDTTAIVRNEDSRLDHFNSESPNETRPRDHGQAQDSPRPDFDVSSILREDRQLTQAPASDSAVCLHHPNTSLGFTAERTTTASKDDVDAMVYYRYQIAPLFDLGMGTLYFGVSIPITAGHDDSLQAAVLALADTHRAVRGSDASASVHRTGFQRPQNTIDSTCVATSDHQCAMKALVAWQNLLVVSPESWSSIVSSLLHDLEQLDIWVKPEVWQLLARMSIATTLLPLQNSNITSTLLLQLRSKNHTLLSVPPNSNEQHSLALQLLQQSLNFLPAEVERQHGTNFPLVSAWQKCWSEVQMWYSLRVQDLRHILEIPPSGDASSQNGIDRFPAVIFSNASAVHSNICHHLTAIILLQNKPRLVRPTAENGSSTSLIWHAIKIIGIVANASEVMIGDFLILAALVIATQLFSHAAQRAQAARLAVRSAGLISAEAEAFTARLLAQPGS